MKLGNAYVRAAFAQPFKVFRQRVLRARGHDAISHSCDVVRFGGAEPRTPQVTGLFPGTELASIEDGILYAHVRSA